MTGPKTEKRFEVWSVPEFPLAIEYAPPTLDEICLYALNGMKTVSRGGGAVGGVLFGARGEQLVRILTWRPILSENAKSAAPIAPQSDRLPLSEMLEDAKADPELADLHAVGWFVSHPRGAVTLTASDLKVYDHYFPWSWQITLVLAPSRESTRAGFFFRNREGSVQADASLREFELAARAPAPEAPRPQSVAAEKPLPPPPALPPASANLPEKPREFRPPDPHRRSLFSDWRLWIWAVPLLLAMVVGAMLIERPTVPSSSPPLGLHLDDTRGELHVAWNRSAAVIGKSVRGELAIRDGGTHASPLVLSLDGDRLRDGSFTYTRKSSDLEVKLTVYPSRGKPVEESARFVGDPAPAVKEDTGPLRERISRSEAEIERLREELRKATYRNHELEDAVRILQNRLQVEQLHRTSRTRPTSK